MSQSVAGRKNYPKFAVQNRHDIAFADNMRGALILCLLRSVDHKIRPPVHQFFYAANVIVMVMRQQNGDRGPLLFFNRCEHRRRFAWIDDQAAAPIIV